MLITTMEHAWRTLFLLLFLCIPMHVSLSWTQWASKAFPSWGTASRYLPTIVTCSNSSLILSVNSLLTNDNNSNFNTDVSSISQPRRTVICFVNGIHHSVEDCRVVATRLGEIFGDEVRAFYNPSTGVWLSDVSRAGLELFTKPGDLVIAKGLALHLRKALKDVGTQGRVLHMAHSGGAIMTYLAAKHHLTREETDRIDLVTFGGGRSITRKYFGGGRIVNYYSRNDPLLMVDGRAQTLFKLANKISNNHNQNNHNNQNSHNVTEQSKQSSNSNNNYTEVRDLKHNTTFIFLNALANQVTPLSLSITNMHPNLALVPFLNALANQVIPLSLSITDMYPNLALVPFLNALANQVIPLSLLTNIIPIYTL